MPVSEAVAVDSGASARSRACPRIVSRSSNSSFWALLLIIQGFYEDLLKLRGFPRDRRRQLRSGCGTLHCPTAEPLGLMERGPMPQVLGERASTRDRGNSRPSVPHHGPNHRRGASAGLQLPVEAHEMSASGGANLPNAVFVNIFRATAATARRVVARGGRVGHCASLRGSFSRAMLSGSRYRVRGERGAAA